ncbi:unnamed protein product, partial [Mesorhabditis belari]|uniref:Tetratricopeptide repeat protein n=1 Tax=Mesorhabditis belari TaxID=2138241 RepID=A0AAF3F2V0_9BILA
MEQADEQFNFVVNTSPDNIPATLGRACIAFQKKDYKTALLHYKKALKLKPDCAPDVRLGIGHCLVRLGKLDKARIAFERCLEMDKHNISAMATLAIMDNNLNTPEGVQQAVNRFNYAYKLEQNHPIVLNHLANRRRQKNGILGHKKDMLTRLLTIWPDDVEALIDLAQLTEHIGAQKSLVSYQYAAKILTEREEVEVEA